ncbi:ATP-binding protein [Kitasatospora sp. NPDC059571]|uniref:ATP-binding protein n=1 Tax=Kitasatospora sp. NPDC059571 TaxID=3346871 RepID=UPI0036CD14D4
MSTSAAGIVRHRRVDFRPGDGTALGIDTLRQTLADWHLTGRPAALDILLVAAELLANAVQHTPGPLHMDLEQDGGRLRISVTDPLPDPPRPRPHRAEAVHGHGLFIVGRLTSDWGHRPDGPGKTVWADIPASDS